VLGISTLSYLNVVKKPTNQSIDWGKGEITIILATNNPFIVSVQIELSACIVNLPRLKLCERIQKDTIIPWPHLGGSRRIENAVS
jgi:hypothetical protein